MKLLILEHLTGLLLVWWAFRAGRRYERNEIEYGRSIAIPLIKMR